MKIIKNSQSLFDNLIRVMPELGLNLDIGKDYVDPLAARSLFSIWRTAKAKDKKVYKRPSTLSQDDINRMKKAGLVNFVGDKIEVTSKGEKVIKVMILGDDKSSFEDNGEIVDYNTALSNTKRLKLAKNNKVASWWDRFEEDEK